ncbi:MAG TPA: hypothetical protein PKC21_06725 [Oligoflexia bacterium]|nr:hypothetical protein [Oligoflexia bacterium]HMR25030.1 hypothetical protein [Oligoflexia bacterium]
MFKNNKNFFVVLFFNIVCFVQLTQAGNLELNDWLNQYAHSNFFMAERKVIPIEKNYLLLPDNHLKSFFNSEDQEIKLPFFAKDFINNLNWLTKKQFFSHFNVFTDGNQFFINTSSIDCDHIMDERSQNYQQTILNAITQLSAGELLIVETGKSHALDVFLALGAKTLESTGVFFQVDDDSNIQSDLRQEKVDFYEWVLNEVTTIPEKTVFSLRKDLFKEEEVHFGQNHDEKNITQGLTIMLIEKYRRMYCNKIEKKIDASHVDLGLYTPQSAKVKNAIIFSDTHSLEQPLAMKKLPSAQQLKDTGIHTVKVMIERFSMEDNEASVFNDQFYSIEERALTHIVQQHIKKIKKDYPRLHHAYQKHSQQNMSFLERIDERFTLIKKLVEYEQSPNIAVKYINGLDQ